MSETRAAARALLGVAADADAHELRAAYRRELLRTHPDLSRAGDATERTVELTRAYQLLLAVEEPGPAAPTAPPTAPSSPPPTVRAEPADVIDVALLDDQTIAVAAPPNETLLFLIEAANRLGEISYLDPSAGLLEVVVEFIEAPTSSVVLSLQGRATGITEVFCTVEPLSGGEAPPSDAVTRLLLDTLVSMSDPPTTPS